MHHYYDWQRTLMDYFIVLLGSEYFSCYVTLLEYCLTTGIDYWDILHSISATFGPSIGKLTLFS